jgi:hypothetical protein
MILSMTAIVKLAILAAVLVFWVLRLLQLGKDTLK